MAYEMIPFRSGIRVEEPACTISPMKSPEVSLAVGLLFLGVPTAYYFGSPIGMTVAGVIGMGCLAAVFRRMNDDEDGFAGSQLFLGTLPWTDKPAPQRKPKLEFSGHGFRQVVFDEEKNIWTEQWRQGPSFKAFVLAFTNYPHADGKGTDANGLRAHIQWTYDTGVIGPNFSPATWLDEAYGRVDIPVGWCKRLLLGIRVVNDWNGYENSRIDAAEAPKSHSDSLPFLGTMVIQLIGNPGEVWFEAKFEWSENFAYHPSIKQLS